MSDHFKGWQDGHLPPPEIPEQEPAEQIKESGGPTVLDIGAIADGGYLLRSGTDIVGTDITSVREGGGQILDLGAIPDNSVLTRSGTDIVGQGVWQPYTPTWTASVTNPSIGNGTLSGKYIQIGKFIQANILIQFGSTTSFGNGDYIFRLPVKAKNNIYVGPAWGALAGNLYVFCTANSGLTHIKLVSNGAWYVAHNKPGIWANGDWITISVSYECE